MIDYLAWLLPGTTEEEAIRIGAKLSKKLKNNFDVVLHTVLQVTEDHLLKGKDVCLKKEGWGIRDTPLEKGQLCLFYRANFAGQRRIEALVQKEKAYQFTLSWAGNEISEGILQIVAPIPEAE